MIVAELVLENKDLIMNKGAELYIPVYEKLEDEVLKLSSSIYFVDDLLGVYSLNIADLIIRGSIEIESLIKDIYRRENNDDPASPAQGLKWIELEWEISKKCISIVSPYFHFDSLRVFKPFEYTHNSKEDYYSVYNAIKHHRAENISKADIYTLTRVMGALYILNIINKGERFYLNYDRFGESFDKSIGSKIFSCFIAPCKTEPILTSQEGVEKSACLYRIIRKESEYSFKIVYQDCNDEIRSINLLQPNDEFQQYAKECAGKSMPEDLLWEKVGMISGMGSKESFYILNRVKRIIKVSAERLKASYWAELNRSN